VLGIASSVRLKTSKNWEVTDADRAIVCADLSQAAHVLGMYCRSLQRKTREGSLTRTLLRWYVRIARRRPAGSTRERPTQPPSSSRTSGEGHRVWARRKPELTGPINRRSIHRFGYVGFLCHRCDLRERRKNGLANAANVSGNSPSIRAPPFAVNRVVGA
jgi:hypothetical protein